MDLVLIAHAVLIVFIAILSALFCPILGWPDRAGKILSFVLPPLLNCGYAFLTNSIWLEKVLIPPPNMAGTFAVFLSPIYAGFGLFSFWTFTRLVQKK